MRGESFPCFVQDVLRYPLLKRVFEYILLCVLGAGSHEC